MTRGLRTVALVACAIVLALLPHSVRAADAVVRPDSIVRPDSLRPAIQRMLPPDSMRRLSDPKWRARMAVQQRDSSSAATTAQTPDTADSVTPCQTHQNAHRAILSTQTHQTPHSTLKRLKTSHRASQSTPPDRDTHSTTQHDTARHHHTNAHRCRRKIGRAHV